MNLIFRKIEDILKFLGQKPTVSDDRALYEANRDKALKLIKSRVEYFNKFYNFKVGQIRVKNHRSIWGSCSRRGNLNFNYKLLFLPDHLINYVIVHEICHLKEFNHGKNFWALVAKFIPDHKAWRDELHKHQFRYF
jgi:hypothetical protein